MKKSKFNKEIKNLLYFIREYGIQHTEIKYVDIDDFFVDIQAKREFVVMVHKGFNLAQNTLSCY